jgi:hypothetical protein
MLDFSKIKTYPIKTRVNKEKLSNFFDITGDYPVLENENLKILSKKIITAYKNKKKVILMLGGHVLKVGCTPFIIDLMKKGVVSHVAVNGSFPIHDFEIALIGETSEYVDKSIEDGSFGMSEETGNMLNTAAINAHKEGIGLGLGIGKMIHDKDLVHKDASLSYTAYKYKIPFTVHTAVGTEIIYQHPKCDGAAMGQTSYHDFKLLATSLSELEKGVVINIGSAVIMPEVFLKAFTITRNLGYEVKNFTAANMDMLKHYRPTVNVVERPTSLGGIGLQIQAKHEETIPTLYKLICDNI